MPTPSKKSDTLLEDQVAAYLGENPDFFQKRDDLITKLELSHNNRGQAVSLLERQVSILRDRNVDARRQIDQLLQSAKKNTDIFDKCHRLVLALIEAQDPGQFFRALDDSLKSDFKCPAFSLVVFGKTASRFNHFTYIMPLDDVKPHVGNIIKSGEPVLGILGQEHQDFLFRHASDQVKSAAILSINRRKEHLGVLSIGSDDPSYFEPGMGTLFLGFIADTLSRLLPKFIYLEGNDQ